MPQNWAHGHNHVLLTFRLYYNGDKLDPTFPAPIPPRIINVPQERPREDPDSKKGLLTSPRLPGGFAPGMVAMPVPLDPLEQRRKILTEVREHLDLLKEFEGIISEEDLAQRKRDLFRALPPAPPPNKESKRLKTGEEGGAEEQQPTTNMI